MKSHKMLTLLLILTLAGCVPSLHQLWTKETLAYDPYFTGRYIQEGSHWTIAGDADKKTYHIKIEEGDEKVSELIGRLVDLQGNLFFDFYPEGELNAGDWTKMHLIGVHLFYKVDKTKDGFTLAIMDPDTTEKLLAENPSLVKHERLKDPEGSDDERIILTDTPENLQKYVLSGLKVEKFFGDPEEIKRVKDGPTSESPKEESTDN